MSATTLPSYVEDLNGGYVTLSNAWVRRWVPVLSGYAVSVYLVLKTVGGAKHRYFYGLRALERMVGQSRERLLKSIAELEKHGLLIVERSTTDAGDAGTNTYYITQTSIEDGEVVRRVDHPVDTPEVPSGNSGGVVRRADHGSTPDEPGWCATQTRVVRRADQIQIHKTTASQTTTKKTATIPAPSKAEVKAEVPVVVLPSTNTETTPVASEDISPVSTPEHIKAALAALMGMGVKPLSVARQLVERHGEQVVIDWVEAVKGGYVDTSLSGPGAVLRSSLRGNTAWDLPPAYLAARQDKQRRAEQQAIEKERVQRQREAAESARVERDRQEQRWQALTPELREQIERQAHAEIAARPTGSKWLEKAMGREELRLRCLQLMAHSEIASTLRTLDKAA